jgi:predicted ATPase/class 3 adenylate cyclase
MPESHRANAPLATGTVTLLFTDIEGSTALWEQDGPRMSKALAAHDALARSAVESHRGTVVKMIGDGMHAAFGDALDALKATVDLQRALADPAATHGVPLRVRCGLHTGMAERRDNDYFGSPVNRAARIMSAAHGGQVLVSQAVVDGIRATLPAAVALRDLGKVRLRDLSTPEHVYQVVHPELRQEFPALRSLEATPNNLPQQATSFIGRDKELAELRRMLASTRLLTLTGSGGCGKTRLALQVAADSLEAFADGAWLVELAPLSDPALVAQAVATVLGLKEEPGKPIMQTLAVHLEDKRLLLLLDNCEHLLDGCAKLADALLRQCLPLTILATSREVLGMAGEQAYRVPSLSMPDPKHAHTAATIAPFAAVQLFAGRALLGRPDFRVTDQNASALASICHRLDGIPLAIELAAARVRSLSVEQIGGKLDQRFRLLTGGSRTALPRQQTLRSLIDWSYDLLDDRERRLLQRLSVFAGGWTLEAAEQVCSDAGAQDQGVVDLLTSLCDKSLVVVEESGGYYRYRLLETVRQYARERLLEGGDGETFRERHRDCIVALAEAAAPKLRSSAQLEWLRRLEFEHENLRAALEWSLAEPGSRQGLRLCGALQFFWIMRGHLSEGREWCARFLAKAGADERTKEHASVLNAAGLFAYRQGDCAAARALHEKSLAIRRQMGDKLGVGVSLGNLGLVAADEGDHASAKALHEESLAIARELGNRNGIVASIGNLGSAAHDRGDFAAARALYAESLAILRELGDRQGTAITLHRLALIDAAQGDHPAAGVLYRESLTILRELGDSGRIAYSLHELAAVAAALGSPVRAARLWGAEERLRAEVGSPVSAHERPDYDREIAAARAALGDDPAFDRAWQDGSGLTLEQAIALAMEESVERP